MKALIGELLQVPEGMTGADMQKFIDERGIEAFVGNDLIIYDATHELRYFMHIYGLDIIYVD